jgi:hypothetical protein
MAGTCNDCGTSTWGRYRICPECRKARKRKSPHAASNEPYLCNDCGYGWRSKKTFGSPSICPRCKSKDIVPYRHTKQYAVDMKWREEIRKKEQKKKRMVVLIIIGIWIALGAYSWFQLDSSQDNNMVPSNENINTDKENLPPAESPVAQLTPEEKLLNFCKTKFSELGIRSSLDSSHYFEDYDSASSWIETKYPNEGLTVNLARFHKEWYLDKAEFPIYILEGEYWENQNVGSPGVYYCDKTGIIQRN